MKLETFFEKFDQFADAPNAVERMRELVLEFAVRGLLSERSENDQAAPAWREFIKEFDHRIYSYDPGPPPPFEIPDEWRWVCLNDLGKTKARNDVADGTRVAFTPMALIPAAYGFSAQSEERTWSEVKKGFTHFADGDVVMAKITPCFENGKSAVMRKLLNGVGAGTTELHVFRRESDVILPEFVLIYLKTRGFIKRGEPRMTGSAGQKRIPHDYFAGSPFPLPPPAEQKRIVAKVDELMALCDRLEAQQQEREKQGSALARAALARFADAPTPSNLNFLFHKSYTIPPADLRKSILTLAVQGKLVPQDPNDEPAEEILGGIAGDVAKAVRAQRMRNSRPIPTYEDEFPFDLPVGWAWAPLGTLTAAEDGAMCDGPFGSKLKTEHYIPTKGYAVLRLGNIGVGYFIHGKEGHISLEHFDSLTSNHTAPGDLLVAGLADPLVRCCEIPPDIGPAVNKSDCFRVRLSPRMNRSYVRHYLNSPIAKAFAAEENHGMTRERINLANAKALPVSIPPLAEQRRIVAKVEQLMGLVDTLETQLTASRATGERLLEALVAELTATA